MGGGAQEIFAKVRTLLLRKKVMSLIHIMIIPIPKHFFPTEILQRGSWDLDQNGTRLQNKIGKNRVIIRIAVMLEIFRQLCSFISQIYGASGECVHISQSYIKRTSEGIQKVRGLFYVAIWNLTVCTYFLQNQCRIQHSTIHLSRDKCRNVAEEKQNFQKTGYYELFASSFWQTS